MGDIRIDVMSYKIVYSERIGLDKKFVVSLGYSVLYSRYVGDIFMVSQIDITMIISINYASLGLYYVLRNVHD